MLECMPSVVEKEATFARLLDDGILQRLPLIMISGRGMSICVTGDPANLLPT